MLVIGHRGAAARAPENTASSLAAGIEAGAGAIEFDVGLSADGRAVLLHDRTLDRTTSGRGPLEARTWDALQRLDAGGWFSPRFAGERLLDLDGALALVRGRAAAIVEIKSRLDDDAGRAHPADLAAIDAVGEALARTGGLHGATLSSSNWEVVRRAVPRLSGLAVALTVRYAERRDPVAWAARIGATELHVNRRRCVRSLVASAHRSGLVVYAYTVNRPGELSAVAEAGADGIFTDDPAWAIRLLRSRGGEPREDGTLDLGIDQGSGGTRAVLVDAKGRVVAQRSVRLASIRRGRDVVVDPDAVVGSIARAAIPLLDAHRGRVRAAGLAVQRGSVLVWRRAGLRADTPVLSWRGGAPAGSHPELGLLERRIRSVTGLTGAYPYGAIRIRALANADADLARALRSGRSVAGPLGAFLAARLTGSPDAPCDPSLAQRMLVYDLSRSRWDELLAEAFGIPLRALPPLAPSVAPRGMMRLGGHRIPLLALAGDVGAAARAVGGSRRMEPIVVLGTGGFLLVPSTRRTRVPGLLTSLLWSAPGHARFAVEGTVHGIAASIREAVGDRYDRSEPIEWLASRGALARRRPRVLPAIEGLGTPDWDLEPRFEVEPGRYTADEVVAGTIEGLADRFARIAERLEGASRRPDHAVATGGLAFAPHLVAAISRRTAIPLRVDPRPHTTALGAALLAGDGVR